MIPPGGWWELQLLTRASGGQDGEHGHCRIREAGRGFRLDRIRCAEVTAEAAPARELATLDPALATATHAESLESFTNRA